MRDDMLRSLRECIDYSSAIERMVTGIFAALANYERELIHEPAAVARQAVRTRAANRQDDPRAEPRIRSA